MTNPTLERAARALARGRADPKGVMSDEEVAAWAEQVWTNKYIRANLFRDARAVLMAVREPDETMVKAAEDREEEIVGTYGCADPTGGFEIDGPKICFVAMIDAILGEGEGE